MRTSESVAAEPVFLTEFPTRVWEADMNIL